LGKLFIPRYLAVQIGILHHETLLSDTLLEHFQRFAVFGFHFEPMPLSLCSSAAASDGALGHASARRAAIF
jgi:hypothetical protein